MTGCGMPRPSLRGSGQASVRHRRWTLENQGFNRGAPGVNRGHADPVYKHEPRAMLHFRLLAMACLHVFPAFYRRNLKPAVRRVANMLNVARRIAAELPINSTANPARAPP